MKTIVIAHNYTTNSFAAMSYYLANFLAENGYKVIFISHKPYFSNPLHLKTEKSNPLIIYSWSSKNRPTGIRDFYWYLKIYLKHKPSIVIGHFVGSNITSVVSKILSFGQSKNFIYYHTLSTQINLDLKSKNILHKFKFYRKKMFYNVFCDTLICPSDLAKRDLKEYFNISKSKVVLNPMSDRFIEKKSASEDKIFISYLGRFDKSKGIVDLIKAFLIYKNNNEESKIILNIAGSGDEEWIISQLIKEPTDIKYFGKLEYNEIDYYLNASHFTIIPSKFDNLPTVGLESLMNGTPLLISTSTGLSEYLTDNVDCYKFEPNIDAIVEILYKVEHHFESHELMCKSARKTYLDIFSMDNYLKNILDIIK